MALALLMKIVAGVDVTMNDHYSNIQKLQKIITIEVLGSNFSLRKLEEINRHMGVLIDSLNHWLFYDNKQRYYYDLKSFLIWLKKQK